MDAYRKRKRLLTKRVPPQWYHRYGDILPEDGRTYVQPLREIKEEKAMLEAMRTPPNANAQAESLVKKLMEEKTTRVKAVLKILEGKMDNLDIQSLKHTDAQSPLSYVNKRKNGKGEALVLRQRVIRPLGYVLKRTSKWRLFWENKIVMQKFKNMMLECHAARVHAKWRKAIRLVRCCVRFASAIAIIAQTTAEVFKEFFQVHKQQSDHRSSTDLVFDKSAFKTKGAGKDLDTDSMFTLTKPEIYRTPEAICKAAEALKFLKAFSNFPVDLQEKMAAIGWYIEVPPDKVIIRQGQYAQCFYFIMAGTVVKAQIQGKAYKSATGFEILKTYEMGDIIGVDALTDRGMRTYSISSIEDSKLISVNVDDYNRICLTSNVPGENPDHIRLLSQLACMRYFPMRKLTDDAVDNVMLFYFTANTVISEDIAKSEYIFVVKKSELGTPDYIGSITSLASMQQRLINRRRDSNGPGVSNVVDVMDNLTKSWTKGTIATSLRGQSGCMTLSEIKLVKAASIEKVVHKDSNSLRRKSISTQRKQWLLVRKLQESDVIGIETLNLGDPSDKEPAKVAVISEGAEVIFMSKAFFLNNATPRMLMDLRSLGFIFPDEATLKAELARQKYWRRYQTKIMKEVFGKRRPPTS